MKNKKYTDEELFQMILEGKADRNVALQYIYTNWKPSAFRIVRSKGHSTDHTEDAVHDGMILLDKKIRNGECEYQKEGAIKNYFNSLCVMTAYSKKRSLNKMDFVDETYKMDGVELSEPQDQMIQEENKKLINIILNKIGINCKEVLNYYKLGYTYEEIAQECDLGSANNARQTAFSCRNKMKKLILENKELKDFFKSYIPGTN